MYGKEKMNVKKTKKNNSSKKNLKKLGKKNNLIPLLWFTVKHHRTGWLSFHSIHLNNMDGWMDISVFQPLVPSVVHVKQVSRGINSTG